MCWRRAQNGKWNPNGETPNCFPKEMTQNFTADWAKGREECTKQSSIF